MPPGRRTVGVDVVIGGDYKGAAAAFKGTAGAARKFTSSIKSSVAPLGAVAAATGIATGGLAALRGATAATVGAYSTFDDAMTRSTSIMGDLSDTMRRDLSDAAREVGRTTRFGADQAAEALYFLASAGLTAEQSLDALPEVAAFATAGNFDLATATDLATDSQAAIGLASKDAAENLAGMTRTMDVLAKAETAANATSQQFAESITSGAGAAARQLGIDLEETTAVLGVYANQGIKGSEAGTRFAQVTRDLSSKALQNADAFAAAGVAVYDAEGNFRNMADIIADLEAATEGTTTAQQKQTLASLGLTNKSIGATVALIGQSEAIRDMETELNNAAGTVENLANKQLSSASAQFDLLKSRVADVALGIGSELVPVLLDVGNALGLISQPLSAASAEIENLIHQSAGAEERLSAMQGHVDRLTGAYVPHRDEINLVAQALGINLSGALDTMIQRYGSFYAAQQAAEQALRAEIAALEAAAAQYEHTRQVASDYDDALHGVTESSDAAAAAADNTTSAIDRGEAALLRQAAAVDNLFAAFRNLDTQQKIAVETAYAHEEAERRLTQAKIQQTLAITAQVRAHAAELEVIDDVLGIPEQYLETATQARQRADAIAAAARGAGSYTLPPTSRGSGRPGTGAGADDDTALTAEEEQQRLIAEFDAQLEAQRAADLAAAAERSRQALAATRGRHQLGEIGDDEYLRVLQNSLHTITSRGGSRYQGEGLRVALDIQRLTDTLPPTTGAPTTAAPTSPTAAGAAGRVLTGPLPIEIVLPDGTPIASAVITPDDLDDARRRVRARPCR